MVPTHFVVGISSPPLADPQSDSLKSESQVSSPQYLPTVDSILPAPWLMLCPPGFSLTPRHQVEGVCAGGGKNGAHSSLLR